MITLEEVLKAQHNIKDLVQRTPLEYMKNYSEKYQANIYFKREDLQVVRSYKIRGAYNRIKNLSKEELSKGVVCASAGNHAQGVALACQTLGVHGVVYMPVTTPRQKISQVQMFGQENIKIELVGDTYDASYQAAMQYCEQAKATFVHPFNDHDVMAGQGTVGLEILDQIDDAVDYVFLPVGGGGLGAGVSSVFKSMSPNTTLVGVEPVGAPSFDESKKAGKVVELKEIEKFVDGAAVKKMGSESFEICNELIRENTLVAEGAVCTSILKLYNENAIVVEPAGALSITALEQYKEQIKDKTVVCIVSGGNNDITRMEEMKERSLLHEGLKHYFLVQFPQRPGALKEFVVNVLGDADDITHFEYTKKNQRSTSTAMVAIELKEKKDFEPLVKRMKALGFYGEYLNDNPTLFEFIT